MVPHGRGIRICRASYWEALNPVAKGFKVSEWIEGAHRFRSRVTLHEWVAQAMWDEAPSAFVIEDVFVGRNAKTSIALARYAQAVTSGCRMAWRDVALVPERRLMERDWRFAMGVRPSSKDRADEVPGIMRSVVSNAVEVAGVLGETPHLFDAIALAYVGLRFRAWEAGWEERIPRRKRGVRVRR